MAKTINALFEGNKSGKLQFKSSNGIYFSIESYSVDKIVIRTLCNQPIWNIAQMAAGFTEKDSNMFGSSKLSLIIGNESNLQISLYPGITASEIMQIYRKHLIFAKK